jgi:hypothetical protein
MSESLEDPLRYPIVMTKAGALPQAPADLRTQLVQLVTFGTDPEGNQVMTPQPGFTDGLPGSLIEDIVSTDTAALVLCDRARVELVNSMTPWGANAFLMNQLGNLFGIPSGTSTNVSVGVVFTGTVGFMIQIGFQVSDGTHVFIVQQPGIIPQSGHTPSLLAVAVQTGIFPVPASTVLQIITSVPSVIALTVNNPLAGSGGATVETEQAYRLRILQASIVGCQGSPAFLKTLLMAVPGVVPTQVGIQGVTGVGWKVICGGANPDPYAIAAAIYQAMPDINTLVSSTMSVAGVTQANPGVVTTSLNHGYANGQIVTFSGVNGMTQLNTGSYTVTVVDTKRFSIGVNTTAFGAYTSGGVVAPNLRNNLVSIFDYPDTYQVPFVTPPAQTTQVALTWNAVSTLLAGAVVSQLMQSAIIGYINAVPVGQPVNIFAMQEIVQDAVETLVPPQNLSRMIWTVTANGVVIPPTAGTGLCYGDSESYWATNTGLVTVTQG